MQFDVKNFPALPGETRNPSRPVSQEKLLQPLTGSSFVPRHNDVFVFDVFDANGNVLAVEQDIPNSEYVTVSIACTRNGKPSWIAQGQLTRLDADLQPTCEFIRKLRSENRTINDLLNSLKGKTIIVVDMVEKEFTVFGTKERVKRITPIFEFTE